MPQVPPRARPPKTWRLRPPPPPHRQIQSHGWLEGGAGSNKHSSVNSAWRDRRRAGETGGGQASRAQIDGVLTAALGTSQRQLPVARRPAASPAGTSQHGQLWRLTHLCWQDGQASGWAATQGELAADTRKPNQPHLARTAAAGFVSLRKTAADICCRHTTQMPIQYQPQQPTWRGQQL